MARLDRLRLEQGPFASMIDIPTRFADLDFQMHVNNAAAILMLQEGRVHLSNQAGLRLWFGPLRGLVAGLTVDYAGEILHPGVVRVGTGVLAVGRTSVTFGQVAWQDEAPCLYAQTVVVMADADGPVPIPAELRAIYERLGAALG